MQISEPDTIFLAQDAHYVYLLEASPLIQNLIVI